MSEKRGIGQAVFSLFTLLVAVAGAGIAFVKYRGAQQRERVERVFRYSDQLAAEAQAIARINELGDAFVTAWPGLAASAGPEPSREQLKQVTDDWFVAVINADAALRGAVERMALFYDTLAVCVAERLCDEHTARALFTEQVAGFASTVYPWVAHRNKDYHAATGIRAMCLRNRFCGGELDCPGLPAQLASCQ
jgi:hypothetical protein